MKHKEYCERMNWHTRLSTTPIVNFPANYSDSYYQEFIAEHISARLWVGDLFLRYTYVHMYVEEGAVDFRHVGFSSMRVSGMHVSSWLLELLFVTRGFNLEDQYWWMSVQMVKSLAGPRNKARVQTSGAVRSCSASLTVSVVNITVPHSQTHTTFKHVSGHTYLRMQCTRHDMDTYS